MRISFLISSAMICRGSGLVVMPIRASAGAARSVYYNIVDPMGKRANRILYLISDAEVSTVDCPVCTSINRLVETGGWIHVLLSRGLFQSAEMVLRPFGRLAEA